MINSIKISIVCFVAIMISACSGTPTRLGSPTSSTESAYMNADFTKGRPISAEDCGFQLLLFIPMGVNERLMRANSILMGQAGSDYVSDVKVTESWTYGLVGTNYCTKLDAMAYPKKEK